MGSNIKVSKEIKRKYQMVKAVSDAVVKSGMPGIKRIEYEYFVGRDPEETFEDVVVFYKGDGDAFASRNVTWDSMSAVFAEIGMLLNGGYYTEVEFRRKLLNNKAWTKIDLETAEEEVE